MDPPKTASGSPCKLCKSKGSPCHMHKSFRTSNVSPKNNWDDLIGTFELPKSPKSKSPQFENFLKLPSPVLFEILLYMNPIEIKSLLRVPQVNAIVREERFKRIYDIKHKISSFTIGKRIEGHISNNENIFGKNELFCQKDKTF